MTLDPVVLLPLFPLAAFVVNVFFGRRWLAHWSGHIASAALGLSALTALVVFAQTVANGAHVARLYTWFAIGDLSVDVAFQVDHLSTFMALVVSSISFLIHVYSIGYMHDDRGYWRFFAWLPLFVFFMLMLVLADNYLLMFVGWEGVGLCSYLLIGFWFERQAPQNAATKAFLMNRIGDWGYTVAIVLIFLTFGSFNFRDVFEHVHGKEPALLTAIGLLLFLGATGKSAQIPLYTWLPDAMEGPTPVSALIHAATMVTAGVYMVARSTPLFVEASQALAVVAVIGTLTAIVAATIALVQPDIKRVMAYSTVSQLGYMFLALGVGAPIAAIFHLGTHAFFKALLFLGSGSVIHALGGEQDMRKMGGLKAKLPITYWTMVVAGLALAAIPPFAGFWSKDEIVGAAFQRDGAYVWLWLVALITGGLTAFYITRALWLTFHGTPRDQHLYEHAHESPRVVTVPLVVLAVGAALAGVVLGLPPEGGLVHGYLGSVLEAGHETEHVDYFLVAGLAAISVAVGLAGIAVGLTLYALRRRDPDRLAARARPLYRVLLNKYYVDELYDVRVVGFVKWLFGLAQAFDIHFIDLIANQLGFTMQRGGRALRRLQTGVVGNYALTIVIGLLFVGATFAYLARR